MAKLPSVDAVLGPEMKSTGEAMGIAQDLPSALYKAFRSTMPELPADGGRPLLDCRRRQGGGAAHHPRASRPRHEALCHARERPSCCTMPGCPPPRSTSCAPDIRTLSTSSARERSTWCQHRLRPEPARPDRRRRAPARRLRDPPGLGGAPHPLPHLARHRQGADPGTGCRPSPSRAIALRRHRRLRQGCGLPEPVNA